MSRSKERIRDSQLRYRQGLGQNFIYDEDLLAALAAASGVTKDDDVLEIGPGIGSLTKHLCAAAGHVTAVELDERLIPLLNAYFAETPNFSLVQGDVLQLDLKETVKDLRKPVSVVANIPYYITTPLITALLTSGVPMKRLALMVQKEVAGKILSGPGEEGWGMLPLRCRYFCEPYLAMDVPAACFDPKPKVDSAFIVLPVRETPAVRVKSEEMFFRAAQAAFALRRKTMANCLCAAFRMERAEAAALLADCGLDGKVRGERLTLAELAALADRLTEREERNA